METIMYIVKATFLLGALFYASAVVAAWIYEMRISGLYKKMKAQIAFLESLGVSSAVFCIKTYKITHDYHRSIAELERVQRFLFEKVLLIARKNEKVKGSFLS